MEIDEDVLGAFCFGAVVIVRQVETRNKFFFLFLGFEGVEFLEE